MNGILWYGWMHGRKDEEAELRALGVMGPMGWHPEAEVHHYDHNNYEHLDGVFTHCTCTEATMYRLISERPRFWPGSFTGCYAETGEQLPRDQQIFGSLGENRRYWVKDNMPPANVVNLGELWDETFPDRPRPNLRVIQ